MLVGTYGIIMQQLKLHKNLPDKYKEPVIIPEINTEPVYTPDYMLTPYNLPVASSNTIVDGMTTVKLSTNIEERWVPFKQPIFDSYDTWGKIHCTGEQANCEAWHCLDGQWGKGHDWRSPRGEDWWCWEFKEPLKVKRIRMYQMADNFYGSRDYQLWDLEKKVLLSAGGFPHQNSDQTTAFIDIVLPQPMILNGFSVLSAYGNYIAGMGAVEIEAEQRVALPAYKLFDQDYSTIEFSSSMINLTGPVSWEQPVFHDNNTWGRVWATAGEENAYKALDPKGVLSSDYHYFGADNANWFWEFPEDLEVKSITFFQAKTSSQAIYLKNISMYSLRRCLSLEESNALNF